MRNLLLLIFTLSLSAKETVLLTEPRSGTHWLQASIQYLTHRPVLPFNPCRIRRNIRLHTFGLNILEVKLDQKKAPFYRAHTPKEVRRVAKNVEYYSKHNRLILLTRNYHKSLPRHMYSFQPDKHPDQVLKEKMWFADDYIDRFRLYEQWPPENRLLIYYEDLMKNTYETMNTVLDFMEEPKHRLKNYHENFASLEQQSITFYKNVVLGKKERKLITFSKKTSKWLDYYLEKQAPKLYEKYLRHYRGAY